MGMERLRRLGLEGLTLEQQRAKLQETQEEDRRLMAEWDQKQRLLRQARLHGVDRDEDADGADSAVPTASASKLVTNSRGCTPESVRAMLARHKAGTGVMTRSILQTGTGTFRAVVVTACCLVAMILAGWAWATRITTYEDCVLHYVKAGMSDYATRALQDACFEKYPDKKQ